jgi:hypothetical protein
LGAILVDRGSPTVEPVHSEVRAMKSSWIRVFLSVRTNGIMSKSCQV